MDEEAWAHLLRTHYPRLCSFLGRKVGDAAVAEDLASQVFVEAVARIDRFEWRGLPFDAWLFRIARNLSNDYFRKQGRLQRAPFMPAEETPLGHELEREAEAKQVQAAMIELTDEQRDVLTLRFVDGFSTESTAAVMKKSTGAIKAIQHRGLASMRRALVRMDPASWRGK